MLQNSVQLGAIESIHAALLYLAGVCDGAGSIDGHGFNKVDAEFGHDLARKVPHLSYRQTIAALKLLTKYQKQLAKVSIDLPTFDRLVDELDAIDDEVFDRPSKVVTLPVKPAKPDIVPADPWLSFPQREGLTEQQKMAYDRVCQWWVGSDRREKPFVLSGQAGTGKSFTASRIVHAIRSITPKARVALCSPTHKATKVLQDFARSNGLNDVHVCTVHSLLHVKPGAVNEFGRRKLEPIGYSREPHFYEFDLVVIDESSMIGDELLKLIDNHATATLFMGDINQLAPVEEEKDGDPSLSPVFGRHPEYQVHLDQVVRYQGEVLRFATELCSDMHRPYPVRVLDAGNLRSLPGEEWEADLLQAFSKTENSTAIKVLAFTNKRVEGLNQKIRSHLNPDITDKYIVGEPLICKEPIMKTPTRQEWRSICEARGYSSNLASTPPSENTIVYGTSEDVVVRSVAESIATVHVKAVGIDRRVSVPCYLLSLENPIGIECDVWAVDIASTECAEMKRVLLDLKTAILEYKGSDDQNTRSEKKRGWKQYYEVLEQLNLVAKGNGFIDRLQYGYASTIHQSQGSTYSKVYADFNNIFAATHAITRNQLRYVAATRTSGELIVLQNLPKSRN